MRILVVDDETSVRSCISHCLREEGYDVIEAYDGFSALEIASEQRTLISVVLTDIHMPGMDGLEMWQRMKPVISPDCKVLFMSGMDKTKLPEGLTWPGEFLQKPFSFKVLVQVLGQVLQ